MKKVFVILVISCFFACSMAKKPKNIEAPETPKTTPKEIKAIEFSLKDINGKKVSLKDFRNKKVVLLEFWATWCPYCRKEIPKLKTLHKQFAKKEFEILAINVRESKKTVSSFINKKDIRYTVLLDTDGSVAKSYNVLGVPTNIIVGKNGNIKYKANILPVNTKDFIEKLLK